MQSSSKKQILADDDNDDDLPNRLDFRNSSDSDSNHASDHSMEQIDNPQEHEQQTQGDMESDVSSEFEKVCCGSDTVADQPMDKLTLQQLKTASNKRNFQPNWYKKYSWLTVCLSKKSFLSVLSLCLQARLDFIQQNWRATVSFH